MSWLSKFLDWNANTEVTVIANCVAKSIFAAWAWEISKKLPSRIVVKNIHHGIDHSQAEGFDGEKYIPLTVRDRGGIVAGIEEFPEIKRYREVSLKDWIREQGEINLWKEGG